jgi:hypothetical protein
MFESRILERYFNEFLINNPFALIEFCSGFLPIIFCLIYWKSAYNNSKILIIYSVLILMLEIIGGFHSANSKPNHYVYLLFYLFETIALTIYYHQSLSSKRFFIILFFTMMLSLAAIIYNLINGIDLMDNYSGSIQSICFITISVLCFYVILSKLVVSNLANSTLFFINTGNLIYFSGRFFVCLFILEIVNEKGSNELLNFWYLVSVLLVIHRIFLSIGISKIKHLTTA